MWRTRTASIPFGHTDSLHQWFGAGRSSRRLLRARTISPPGSYLYQTGPMSGGVFISSDPDHPDVNIGEKRYMIGLRHRQFAHGQWLHHLGLCEPGVGYDGSSVTSATSTSRIHCGRSDHRRPVRLLARRDERAIEKYVDLQLSGAECHRRAPRGPCRPAVIEPYRIEHGRCVRFDLVWTRPRPGLQRAR